VQQAEIVQKPFLVIAGVLLLFAAVFWLLRNAPGPKADAHSPNPFRRALLSKPRLMFGVVGIFVYVGAEVSIGSGLTNYLLQPSVLGTQAADLGARMAALLGRAQAFNAAQVAGTMVSAYWGLAMVGRFVGSFALSRITPGKVLAFNALVAGALALTSGLSVGLVAAVAVLAVGLANSIMFPTIFTLALENLHDETPNGSALLCMAIVGGAIIPVIYGATADVLGLAHALIVPVVCYFIIAIYGFKTARGLAN
jgi:FHS family L-fucose permease-like MFS transporter